MADLDALTGEVSEVTVPVLLLLDGTGDDHDVVGTDPLPRPSRPALLRDEEERDDLAPGEGSGALAEGQDQVRVDALFLKLVFFCGNSLLETLVGTITGKGEIKEFMDNLLHFWSMLGTGCLYNGRKWEQTGKFEPIWWY